MADHGQASYALLIALAVIGILAIIWLIAVHAG
jgi:hypothetical protein